MSKIERETDFFEEDDLATNPAPRVPICLCLDTSGSMEGRRCEELRKGVERFYNSIKSDDVAVNSAEVCIVTFGGKAKCISEFKTLSQITELPAFDVAGETPLGEAVNLALDKLDARKEEYKDNGVDYFQPWLVIMTDGYATGLQSEFDRAVKRVETLVKDRKLTVFPIGVGSSADMEGLNKLSPKRQALKLRGLNFKEFFEWLSQSVCRVSQSVVGEKITLDVEAIKAWSEIDF